MYRAGRHERRQGEVRSTATQLNRMGAVLEVNRVRSSSKGKKKKKKIDTTFEMWERDPEMGNAI